MVWLFKGDDVSLSEDYFDSKGVIEGKVEDDYDVDNYEVINNEDNNNYELSLYNKEENDEVLLELYIPRINLRKSVYNMDSSKNNVNLNVKVLGGSDIGLNLYFLASHSGGRRASYFDNLVDLEIGDVMWLYRDGSSLGYVVDDIFYIEKKGYFEASYGSNGNRLFLITCSLKYKNRQLVVTGKLVYSG